MKQLIIILALIVHHQYSHLIKDDKVFKFISNDGNDEYILLQYNPDIEGKYFGGENVLNEGYVYYMADIIIDKIEHNQISFHLSNYRYSKMPVTPFKNGDFFVPKGDKVGLLGLETKFFGEIENEKLTLNRHKLYYDSTADIMVFNLIK